MHACGDSTVRLPTLLAATRLVKIPGLRPTLKLQKESINDINAR